MKVYYITMLLPAPTETFACNDVIALRSLGVDVSVHSLRFPAGDTWKLAKARELDGVRLTYNSVRSTVNGILAAMIRPSLILDPAGWVLKHSFKSFTNLLKSFLLLPRTVQLFTEIEKNNPDVVHLFWGHYPAMLGFLIKKRIPEIVLSVSLGAYDFGMRYGGSADIVKRADLVTTFAEENVKDLINMGASPDRVRVIYRGVDFERYERFTRGIPKTGRKIASVGRLVTEKNMEGVLKVFSGLSGKWPDASLVVLGNGPCMEKLRNLARGLGIEDRVCFRGHVPHRTVLEELKSSEVFLFMSKYKNERLPNAVKEAIFARCFVVAGMPPGIGELIPDEKHGCIVEPGDIDAAQEKINLFFRQPHEYENVLDNAYNHLVKNFNVKDQMIKLKKNWGKLLAGK